MKLSVRRIMFFVMLTMLFTLISASDQDYLPLPVTIGGNVVSAGAKTPNPKRLLIAIEMHMENQYKGSYLLK